MNQRHNQENEFQIRGIMANSVYQCKRFYDTGVLTVPSWYDVSHSFVEALSEEVPDGKPRFMFLLVSPPPLLKALQGPTVPGGCGTLGTMGHYTKV